MWRPTAQDTGPTVIADFDTDISEWNGDTGSWTIETAAPIYHGEGALQIGVTTATWEHLRSVPGMGLPYYPSAGDTVSFRVHYQGNTTAEVFTCFGVQQDTWTPPAYGLRLDGDDGDLSIQKCASAGSGFTTLASVAAPIVDYNTEWLHATVNWGADGTLVGTLYNAAGTQLAQVSATDTDYTDGGVALETNLRNDTASQPRIDYLTAV